MRSNNISGYDYLLACEKESLLGIAKLKSAQEEDVTAGGNLGGNVADVLNRRNL